MLSVPPPPGHVSVEEEADALLRTCRVRGGRHPCGLLCLDTRTRVPLSSHALATLPRAPLLRLLGYYMESLLPALLARLEGGDDAHGAPVRHAGADRFFVQLSTLLSPQEWAVARRCGWNGGGADRDAREDDVEGTGPVAVDWFEGFLTNSEVFANHLVVLRSVQRALGGLSPRTATALTREELFAELANTPAAAFVCVGHPQELASRLLPQVWATPTFQQLYPPREALSLLASSPSSTLVKEQAGVAAPSPPPMLLSLLDAHTGLSHCFVLGSPQGTRGVTEGYDAVSLVRDMASIRTSGSPTCGPLRFLQRLLRVNAMLSGGVARHQRIYPYLHLTDSGIGFVRDGDGEASMGMGDVDPQELDVTTAEAVGGWAAASDSRGVFADPACSITPSAWVRAEQALPRWSSPADPLGEQTNDLAASWVGTKARPGVSFVADTPAPAPIAALAAAEAELAALVGEEDCLAAQLRAVEVGRREALHGHVLRLPSPPATAGVESRSFRLGRAWHGPRKGDDGVVCAGAVTALEAAVNRDRAALNDLLQRVRRDKRAEGRGRGRTWESATAELRKAIARAQRAELDAKEREARACVVAGELAARHALLLAECAQIARAVPGHARASPSSSTTPTAAAVAAAVAAATRCAREAALVDGDIALMEARVTARSRACATLTAETEALEADAHARAAAEQRRIDNAERETLALVGRVSVAEKRARAVVEAAQRAVLLILRAAPSLVEYEGAPEEPLDEEDGASSDTLRTHTRSSTLSSRTSTTAVSPSSAPDNGQHAARTTTTTSTAVPLWRGLHVHNMASRTVAQAGPHPHQPSSSSASSSWWLLAQRVRAFASAGVAYLAATGPVLVAGPSPPGVEGWPDRGVGDCRQLRCAHLTGVCEAFLSMYAEWQRTCKAQRAVGETECALRARAHELTAARRRVRTLMVEVERLKQAVEMMSA